MTRRSHIALLILVLFVSAVFRLIGLNWGVPNSQLPHYPFHPDENWSMRVMSKVNLSEGDYVFENAHREGSLLYYIVTMNALALKAIGLISNMPCCFESKYDDDYATVLIAGRFIIVLFDVFAILLVFAFLRRVVGVNAALLGALVLGIAPFEIVYAHYMRTHIPSNFMLMAVILLSLRIYETDSLRTYACLGVLCGLAGVMRYTTIVVILVPIFMTLIKHASLIVRANYGREAWWPLIGRLGLLGTFTLLGLFIGDPPLFLQFEEMKPYLLQQAKYANPDQFAQDKLLDFSYVWRYLTYLIPHGSGPVLWVFFYLSFLYLLFVRRYYKYTAPLMVTEFVYLYLMAKGYAAPIYVRASLALFPIFAILCGIATYDFFERMRRFRFVKLGAVALLISACVATMLYDVAYVKCMIRSADARMRIYDYLQSVRREGALRIGLFEDNGADYFLTMPTLALLNNSNVLFVEEENFIGNEAADIDYLVLVGYSNRHAKTKRRVKRLVESSEYYLENEFLTDLSIFGLEFDFKNSPPDMQYPLPELFLLRPSGSNDSSQQENSVAPGGG